MAPDGKLHLSEDRRRPNGRDPRDLLVEAHHRLEVVPSIVDAAEHDPVFADIHSRIRRGHAAPVRAALDRAALRGEIPSTADRNAMAAALLGPLFYRRWFSREPIDAKFLEVIIRNSVVALHQDTHEPKRELGRR